MMCVLSRTESTPFSLTPEGRERVRVTMRLSWRSHLSSARVRLLNAWTGRAAQRCVALVAPSFEPKLEIQFALDIALLPGNVETEKISRADFLGVMGRTDRWCALAAIGCRLD